MSDLNLTGCPCHYCDQLRVSLHQHSEEHLALSSLRESLEAWFEDAGDAGVRISELSAWLIEFYPNADELARSMLSAPREDDRRSFVYLMQARPSCALKVGRSVNPKRRRETLRGKLLHDTHLALLAQREAGCGQEAVEAEARLLAEVEALGVSPIGSKREWFPFDERILDLFEGHFLQSAARPS